MNPQPDPEWLAVLKTACLDTSQAAVARQLGVSASTINQVLKGIYKGNLTRLQTLIEGRLMNQTVACPIAGDIPKHKCLEHQARDVRMATVNPLYSRLYRACRSGCPHSQLTKEY
jgi:DNA-binding transcriptional regulator YdaS (Cro superfamily)